MRSSAYAAVAAQARPATVCFPDGALAWPQGRVEVWQIALPQAEAAHGDRGEQGAALADAEALLSHAERDGARRYRRPVDRMRSVVSRASRRRLLGAYLHMPPGAVPLQAGAYGKPALAGAASALAFNTSHGGAWLLHAFGTGAALGVDIEQPPAGGYDAGMLRLFLTPCERAALARMPTDQVQPQALRLWTRKEAWLKARGTGLSADPARLDLPPPGAACSLTDLPAPPGHMATLARLGPAQPVRLLQVVGRSPAQPCARRGGPA